MQAYLVWHNSDVSTIVVVSTVMTLSSLIGYGMDLYTAHKSKLISKAYLKQTEASREAITEKLKSEALSEDQRRELECQRDVQARNLRRNYTQYESQCWPRCLSV